MRRFLGVCLVFAGPTARAGDIDLTTLEGRRKGAGLNSGVFYS
jgi:hypothetical protein